MSFTALLKASTARLKVSIALLNQPVTASAIRLIAAIISRTSWACLRSTAAAPSRPSAASNSLRLSPSTVSRQRSAATDCHCILRAVSVISVPRVRTDSARFSISPAMRSSSSGLPYIPNPRSLAVSKP